MKIAVIWTELSGYLTACLNEFLGERDVELLVISNLGNRPQSRITPYDKRILVGINNKLIVHDRSFLKRYKQIIAALNEFKPDVILYAFQWRSPDTYGILNYARRKKIKIIGTMDNTWQGSLKQLLLTYFVRGLNLLPMDSVWVPGERAAQYAKRLFGSEVRIFRGLYCANNDIFNIKKINSKEELIEPRKNKFVFIGRLVKEKGIKDLIEAYKKYRLRTPNPWDLIIIGIGPLEYLLKDVEGLEHKHFVQQWDLPKFINPGDVFVLPSLFEPWGVVIHEAALMGLPIICSDACGASVELVQDQVNGYVFSAGNVDLLTDCLSQITECSDINGFGQISYQFSKRYTKEIYTLFFSL